MAAHQKKKIVTSNAEKFCDVLLVPYRTSECVTDGYLSMEEDPGLQKDEGLVHCAKSFNSKDRRLKTM